MLMDKKSSRYQVPNVQRTLTILEHLYKNPRGLGLSDIAKELDFPKNSVFRIMNTLLENDYIRRNDLSMKFTLSKKLFYLGYGSLEDNLTELSLDVMRDLRDIVKETILLSILGFEEALVIEQIPGLNSFRFVADPGAKQSIIASASCKAILAYLKPEVANRYINRAKFIRYTANTIPNREQYLQELKKVREQGYALDWAEELDGVHCVAAPILNSQSVAVAAITVTGPSSRIPANQFETIGKIVIEYTNIISKRLGYKIIDKLVSTE